MAENDLLHDFEAWAAPLMQRLAPAARRKVMQGLARELRTRTAARIAAQQNPDGSTWEPRKRIRAQHRRSRIKAQKMYLKMRQAAHLKLAADADSATLKFTGRDAWIARVAQYGLTDRVSRNGPSVRYPVRQLLGFSDADREWIRDFLIRNLLPDA